VLESLLRFRQRPDGQGRPPQDTRAVLNGVLWILHTWAQWRELPKKCPAYQTWRACKVVGWGKLGG
jgi:transposase